ncbi:MAG: MgtC/SapB family protein [Lysobacterales bacterium]
MSLEQFSLDWSVVGYHLILLGVAYILALPIGFNREQHSRSAGLRTFPLVAISTCGFMLVGMDVFQDQNAQSKALQGIITGMGFVGGGAILKGERVVNGLTTAVSLWTTGAIGIAVACQRFEIAIVLSLLTFITLAFGPDAKQSLIEDCEDGDARGD